MPALAQQWAEPLEWPPGLEYSQVPALAELSPEPLASAQRSPVPLAWQPVR